MTLTFDDYADVLYVDCGPMPPAGSVAVGDDEGCYLNLDGAGNVVGLQLIFAREAGRERWLTHREEIPKALFEAVDHWFTAG